MKKEESTQIYVKIPKDVYDHFLSITEENNKLYNALRTLIVFSKTWGREWFSKEDWLTIQQAQDAIVNGEYPMEITAERDKRCGASDFLAGVKHLRNRIYVEDTEAELWQQFYAIRKRLAGLKYPNLTDKITPNTQVKTKPTLYDQTEKAETEWDNLILYLMKPRTRSQIEQAIKEHFMLS